MSCHILRRRPEYDLPVGAKGAVVFVPAGHSANASYVVELLTLRAPEEDLEVISRLGVRWLPGFRRDVAVSGM